MRELAHLAFGRTQSFCALDGIRICMLGISNLLELGTCAHQTLARGNQILMITLRLVLEVCVLLGKIGLRARDQRAPEFFGTLKFLDLVLKEAQVRSEFPAERINLPDI